MAPCLVNRFISHLLAEFTATGGMTIFAGDCAAYSFPDPTFRFFTTYFQRNWCPQDYAEARYESQLSELFHLPNHEPYYMAARPVTGDIAAHELLLVPAGYIYGMRNTSPAVLSAYGRGGLCWVGDRDHEPQTLDLVLQLCRMSMDDRCDSQARRAASELASEPSPGLVTEEEADTILDMIERGRGQ